MASTIALSDYQAVIELTEKNPDLPRFQVFERIAKERGKKVGAIAANYYRINKEKSTQTLAQAQEDTTLEDLIDSIKENLDQIKQMYSQEHSRAQAIERIKNAIAA
jgi:hypothetical protein